MANYIATDLDLESVADAIRTKGGTSADLVFPQGFVDAIDAIQSDIDPDDYYQGIVPEGNMVLDRLTTISAYRGASRTRVTSVTSDTVTTLDGDRIFQNCTAMTELVLPNLTKITGQYIIHGCSGLKRVYMPKLKTVSKEYVFANGGTADCVFVFPGMTSIMTRLFRDVGKRTVADFGEQATTIKGNDVWYWAPSGYNNTAVAIFRSPTLIAAPSASCIAQLGHIYVHEDLVESYQTATNWATKYSGGKLVIDTIEGSIYETQYADGTPIPTT